jgi:DNA-binding transcriptional LysR family regulator
MQDLGGFPLVLIPIEYCLRKMLEAECTEAQIETQVVAEMSSPEGLLQAVAKGPGLTILLELYVRLKRAGAGLRIIDLYDPVPRHSVELAYRGNRYQNITARELTPIAHSAVQPFLASSQAVR